MPRMKALARPRAGESFAAGRAVLLLSAAWVVLCAAVAVFAGPQMGIPLAVAGLAAPALVASVDLLMAALVGVIALLPFGALPLGLGFNPTFLDLTLLALYGVTAARLALRQLPAQLRLPNRWPVVVFLGLLVAALLAGFGQGLPAKNQLRTFGELVLAAGVFFLVDLLLPDRPRLRRVYWLLVASGAISAALGLGLYLLPDNLQIRLLSLLRSVGYPSGPAVLRYLNDDPARLQRATGTAIDPNSFGGLLALLLALLLPQLLSHRPMVPRWLSWGMAALIAAAVVATVSRGSLLGVLAAVVVVGLMRQRRALAAGLALGAVGLVGARLVGWTASYVEHFAAGIAIADRATQMRMGEYRDALTLIQRYPWFGVGFGDPRDVDLYRGVSSLYLIVAESMGLVGLTALLILFAAVVWRAAAAWRRAPDGELADMLLGCLAALAVVLVSGAFDHYFFTYPHAFALLWLLIGLAMALVRLVDSPPANTERSRVCP